AILDVCRDADAEIVLTINGAAYLPDDSAIWETQWRSFGLESAGECWRLMRETPRKTCVMSNSGLPGSRRPFWHCCRWRLRMAGLKLHLRSRAFRRAQGPASKSIGMNGIAATVPLLWRFMAIPVR